MRGVTTKGAGAGLRERKKQATRAALAEAAVRLAAEHGAEHVTVEAISNAAGVSPRTFFNYFDSHDDAFVMMDTQIGERVRRAVRDAPAGLAPLDAVREAMAAELADVERRHEVWGLRAKVLKKSPHLLARGLGLHMAEERDLARTIAHRLGPSAGCAAGDRATDGDDPAGTDAGPRVRADPDGATGARPAAAPTPVTRTASRCTPGCSPPSPARPYACRSSTGTRTPRRPRSPTSSGRSSRTCPQDCADHPPRPATVAPTAVPRNHEKATVTAIEAPDQAPTSMTNRQILQAMSGLMAGMFVAILAGTVVANALPRIIADLGASQSAYTWVVTSELLAMTATVPLWGKLADLYNNKLLLQLSLGMFVIGSLLAGFSQGVELLIFSRVMQGIGAGGLTALAQVVMATVIPPRRLGKYAGMFGAVFAVGTVAGPLVGGVMVDTSWLGWRWCFFIGVPFALLAIALLQRTLHLPTVRRDVKIDYLGAFLIVAGVSAILIWTSLAGNQFDWASWQTAVLTGGGVLLLVGAVYVESKVPEPVIPLGIFRNRTVTLTTIASLLVGVAMFGGTVFLSQYFQISLGKSPTVAGMMGLPMILGLLVSSTVAGQLISATGRWKVYLVAGGIIMTAGLALLSTIDADTGFGLLSLYMVVLGVGVGLLMQNLVLAAQNDVPASELGAATSVLSFFRSMGGTIGTSVLGAILANRVASEMAKSMGAAGGGSGGTSDAVPDVTELPAPVREMVEHAYGLATAELFLVSAPFAALALVAVLFIKEKPLKTTSGMERLAEEARQKVADGDKPSSPSPVS